MNNYISRNYITSNNNQINNQINNQSQINNYQNEINKLKKQLNDEKNKNEKLNKENENLKKIINNLNNENISLKNQIKLLENKIKSNNNVSNASNLLSQNIINNEITSIKPGEKIIAVNFVSNGVQDIGHYNIICKNTDLFVNLEAKLYQDFPDFKNYETYFEVNTRRILRFKTMDENKIKSNDLINVFRIE